jgi:hypothetical protein
VNTVARGVIWFAVAYAVMTVLHELTHALIAVRLAVPATLYNLRVDLARTHATVADLAMIGVSGPVACLAVGASFWAAGRSTHRARHRLPLLLLAAMGLSTFTGNLMSAAFIGDFSAVARLFEVPLGIRYGVSLAGLLLTIIVMFGAGRALAPTFPVGSRAGRAGSMAIMAAAGTALVVLLNAPMSAAAVTARLGEGAFWIVAVFGAATARIHAPERDGGTGVSVADVAALLAAAAVVRVLMTGIPLMR